MRLFLMMLFGMVALSACNTMEGIGRDIESAGGALSSSASETKRKM